MLKSLIKEVGLHLRRKGAPTSSSIAADIDPAERHARFRKAPPQEQVALAQALASELTTRPGDVTGWTLLGDWWLKLGNAVDAEVAYRRGLQSQAMHARAQEGLGLALLRQARLEEAFLHLELAHKADPDDADILTHWGLVDLELGNLGNAAGKFQSAIERVPRNPHAWHNLALVALKQGAVEHSIKLLHKAIELRPDHGLAYSNLAMALRRADRLPEALEAAHKATELKQDNARVWVVLADMHLNLGDFEQSQAALERARQIDARHIGVHVAQGKLDMALGAYDAARQAFETALQINPQHADAQGGLGELQLLLGEWSTGWDLYEARRRVEATPVRRYPYPSWEGEDLRGKTVLVHAEQGMGDIILFASCLEGLERLGAHCVLEVRSRMQDLFARSFPNARVIGRGANAELMDWPQDMPTIDYQLPFGSLPRWFRRSADNFAQAPAAFLRADPARVAQWQARLQADGRRTVGIAWRGGMAGTAKLQRSLPAQALIGALAAPDTQLVCLQYGQIDEELAAAAAAAKAVVHPGLSGFADMDDLAALTVACDAVVTVCSTQAHLTGALGRPGLVLVPSNPSWRYGHVGPRMAWYPSLELIRQAPGNHWTTPLQQARQWVETIALRSANH